MQVPSTITLEHAAANVWDIVVVGGGPAGAMAAHDLARFGMSVLLVDKAAFPRFKVCGCCLNAWGQATLARAGLGDLPLRLGAVPLTRFHFSTAGHHVELHVPHSLAVARQELDAALVRAAIDRGAHFMGETQARLGPCSDEARGVLLSQGGLTVTTQARVVLAADGLGGRLVAGEPEGDLTVDPASRVGAGVLLEDGPAAYQKEIIYMGASEIGYVGLVRLGDGRLNLAAALDPDALKLLGGIGPAVVNVLHEAGLPAVPGVELAPWKGTPPLTRRIKSPAGERWMSLGDAAGYVEPFTGEGMAWALAQGRAVAPLAARAARQWSAEYGRAWCTEYADLMQQRQKWCRRVATTLRHPILTGWLAEAAALFPKLAEPLLRCFSMPMESPPAAPEAQAAEPLRPAHP